MKEQFPDNVANINADWHESPDEVSEADVMREFLSSVRHPGVGIVPTEVAQRILIESGLDMSEAAESAKLDWRNKVRTIELQTAVVSDQAWDELIDENSEQYDTGVAEIVARLQYTRTSRDVELERRALFRLLNLRVAALRVGQNEPEPWIELATRLIPDLPDNPSVLRSL